MDQLKAYLTKRNIIVLLVIAVLAVGLVAGVYLVQQQQVLKSKAAEEAVKFSGPGVDCSGTECETTFSAIDIEVSSPFGPPEP